MIKNFIKKFKNRNKMYEIIIFNVLFLISMVFLIYIGYNKFVLVVIIILITLMNIKDQFLLYKGELIREKKKLKKEIKRGLN